MIGVRSEYQFVLDLTGGSKNNGRMARSRQSQANVPDSAELLREVTALKTQYCNLLDSKDWHAWANLFTADAAMQVGPSPDAVVRGREKIHALLARQLRKATTVHQARAPEVMQEGDDRVRVVWAMNDRVQTPLYLLEGAGFYEDHYVRTAGGWKIARVRLHRTKVDLQPRSRAMTLLLRMYRNGWLGRLAPGASRTLGEALHVGLRDGQRP